ncbi:MAG TPA: Ig-like domain-containing protein, partial [Candidatus Saccharimonadales bacterium]|nr:Ig-like domain-containing protein [Candidatus Saccharimonadales bacterium]
MKTKTNIITASIKKSVLALVALLTVTTGVLGAPRAAAQTCATTTNPATTFGRVTQNVTVASAGQYRVWSRIKVPNTTNNSYYLQLGANTCAFNVGDSTVIPANTWVWISFQNGDTASKIMPTLAAGNLQLVYTGKEADVQLDRVLLLGDLTCVPTGTGGNCADVDAVNPTVSVAASPTSATAGTTVNLSAQASDNVGVTNVEFYVDGARVGADATSPYGYPWNTTGAAAGAHTVTAR